MKLGELLATAGDTMTVRRVFAEPYEKNGVTVIPGAMVSGGGGGGGGHDEKGQEGQGGGFGMNARPAGAFVIKDGNVAWRPAVDVNRLLMVIGAVAVASVLTWGRLRGAQRARSRWGGRRMPPGGGSMLPKRMMRGGPMMRGSMLRGGSRLRGAMGARRMGGDRLGSALMAADRKTRKRWGRELMAEIAIAEVAMAGKGPSGKGMARRKLAGKRMGRKRT